MKDEFTLAPCISNDGIDARVPDSPISLLTLIEAHNGLNPAELAAGLNLSLAQVFAALAYYHSNQALFDSEPARRRAATENWLSELATKQGVRGGWPEIAGKWPGDETDEEIREALERLS